MSSEDLSFFLMTPSSMAILHFACCSLMVGVIWVVQLILYPAFAQVIPSQFQVFHRNHSQKITFIVGPVMLIELCSALALVYFSEGSVFFIFNLLALVLIWLCTFFLSVPLHTELEQGQDSQKISQLVKTNWPRTLLWSFRFIGLLIYFSATFGVFHVHF